ncbi:MAG: SUMF1/EgtB/PvdO family nonheme iron enzyme [Sedimentisphaerales bacterium]|nr:SUMF1/EgtB/PvdO family nonheme iron enzyme [Sedimentisphaerales bacterium]
MLHSRNLKNMLVVAIAVILSVGCRRTPKNEENAVTINFVRIPAGEFMMGSPVGESGRRDNEGPQHHIKITEPFYMSVTEVTQQQYVQIMRNNPSAFKSADYPVERISWNDATKFCRKLSKKTGRKITLPTEAQWEYACRAGTETRFNFKEDERFLNLHCWYGENSSSTNPVAKKKPNEWGLYDMHGNVEEWCSDHFDYHYYSKSPSVDPQGPSNGEPVLRVYRGGCWAYVPDFCRSATREGTTPDDRGGILGFRVVFSARADDSEKMINITLPEKATKVFTGREKKSETQSDSPLTITGVVRDETGMPINDVEMHIWPSGDWLLRRYTEGRFEVYRWSHSLDFKEQHVLARQESRNLAAVVKIKEDANMLDVKLESGVILTGKVVNGNGEAIEGAILRITLKGSDRRAVVPLASMETDAEGKFIFRALPMGYKYNFYASFLRYRPIKFEFNTDDVPDNRIDLGSIILAQGQFSVSGIVVDANHKPVANIGVYCLGEAQSGGGAQTGSDGTFTLDGVFEGQVKIVAGGYKLYGYADTEAGATNVKVVLNNEGVPPPKGRTCFPANTDVWANNTLLKIAEAAQGQTAPFGQIEKIEEHEGILECRDIVLENGNCISVVDAHCFMLDSGEWIAAQDLKGGLRLKTKHGAVGVESVTIRETPFVGKVYNLKIKDSDQYAVGKDGLIVRDY